MVYKPGSLSTLSILLAATVTTPGFLAFNGGNANAQSTGEAKPEFTLPKTVPAGTEVRVNGSSSMMKINDALAQKFKTQYPGTNVKTTYDGTNAGLKAVLEGKSDLAGIGRGLTDAEKGKGLAATSVTRNKIAIFVGKDNPINKSLTIDQFAGMFRGQITDWSKVGGKAGKIRFIDRPDSSDTRSAFANYPVFKKAPFKNGANTVKLKEDSTAAVIQALGKDGIGYAIADQVVDNPNVRVLAMHQVLPTDKRYPFSQQLMYVHKGEKPNTAAQAFLGYAIAPQSQAVVEQARVATVTAANGGNQAKTAVNNNVGNNNAANNNAANNNAANNTTSIQPAKPDDVANAPATAATDEGKLEFPWWLLLIPALGGLLWWLLKTLNRTAPNAVAPVTAAGAVGAAAVGAAAIAGKRRESRLILTPRDAQNGYAYWEIPQQIQDDLHRQGRRGMKLRLYDVTDIDMDLQRPHSLREFNCHERDRDLHVTVPMDNREYVAEIGYTDADENWLSVARSQPVRFPAQVSDTGTNLTGNQAIADEQAAAASLWGDNPLLDNQPATANQVTENQLADVDVSANLNTNTNPNTNIDSSIDTNANTNTNLVNTDTANTQTNGATGIAGVAAAGAAAVGGASLFNLFTRNRQSQPDTTTKAGKIDTGKGDARVILVPRTSDSAYAYWEIPANCQAEMTAQGADKLLLRLYDSTGVDNFDLSTGEPFASYDCTGQNDIHIRIPESERDYIGELGYTKADGGWLKLAQSDRVHVPAEMSTNSDNSDTPDGGLGGGEPGAPRPLEALQMAVSGTAATIGAKIGNFGANVSNAASNGIKSSMAETSATDSSIADSSITDGSITDSPNKNANGWMSGVKKSVGTAFAGGAAAVAGVATATNGLLNRQSEAKTSTPQNQPDIAANRPSITRQQCQIILVPRNQKSAYAYWEVSDNYKQAARNQGGRRFVLRVHDSTNLDIDYQQPHSTQEYSCNEREFDKHVSIPTSDRDYIAEVGYYTDDNRWIRIIRSFHVRVQ